MKNLIIYHQIKDDVDCPDNVPLDDAINSFFSFNLTKEEEERSKSIALKSGVVFTEEVDFGCQLNRESAHGIFFNPEAAARYRLEKVLRLL